MKRGYPGSVWQRWRTGILVSGLLHGAGLLALSVTLHNPHSVAAPPSFAVEMVPAPPAAQPHPQTPRQQQAQQAQPDRPAPPIAPPPPASNGFALLPPRPQAVHSAAVASLSPAPPAPPPAAAVATAAVARAATSSFDPNARVSWESDVLARLEAAKRYPPSARFARQEATIQVQFQVDRKGRVIKSALLRASGITDLDAEALALLRRVRLPPPPATMATEDLTLTVPIEFTINRG